MKYISAPTPIDDNSTNSSPIPVLMNRPVNPKYIKYTIIPITIDANRVFMKHIKYRLIPIGPIFFLKLKNNNKVVKVADILVARARPAWSINLMRIKFNTIFNPTANAPLS